MKFWRLLLMASLLVSACTLTNIRPTREPTEAPDSIGQINTATPSPTPTLTATPTTSPTPTATLRPVVIPPACTVRTSWLIYTVAVGDTLSSIARRVASNTTDLALANCLSNPNLITPGQQLRVPRLPVADSRSGAIRVSPFLYAEGGSYTVRANTTFTLSWPEARRDASRVEFLASPFGSNPPTNIISTDPFPNDGAAVTLSLPVGFQQALHAVAYLPDGSRQLTLNAIPVFSIETGPQVQGDVIISPIIRSDGNVRVLEAGRTVTLTWQGAPVNVGSQFEFTLIEDGVVGPRSIGIDNNGADGVFVAWTVPSSLNNARIVASTRLPGQGGQTISSREVRVVVETVKPDPQGQLDVSPVVRQDNNWLVLAAGEQVTLSWQGGPANGVERVEFYLSPTGTGTTPQIIALDSNASDGISAQWTVLPPFTGHLTARAFLNDGRVIDPANMLQLTSE